MNCLLQRRYNVSKRHTPNSMQMCREDFVASLPSSSGIEYTAARTWVTKSVKDFTDEQNNWTGQGHFAGIPTLECWSPIACQCESGGKVLCTLLLRLSLQAKRLFYLSWSLVFEASDSGRTGDAHKQKRLSTRKHNVLSMYERRKSVSSASFIWYIPSFRQFSRCWYSKTG